MADTLVPTRSGPAHRRRRPVSERPPAPVARRRAVLLGAGALVAVIAGHLAFSLWMRVPIIHPDELGYLQNARFMARGGLRSETEYYPGFSLLLVPVALVSGSPTFVFRGALIVEALLGAVFATLVWKLGPLAVPDLRGRRRAVVTALVCLYPAFVLYGDFALSEVAFTALFAGVVVIAAKAFSGGSTGWWAALGGSAAALALVHPRGLAVVVAVAIMALLVAGTGEGRWARLTALAAAGVGGLAVMRLLVTWTKGKAPGFGAYRPDSVLSKSLSAHGLASLVSELGGQMWYLSLATLGLVPLGLLLGGRALARTARGDRRPWVVVQGFAALAFTGVWALSSLFMNLGNRADKLIYGRYNEGAIAPLLIIALADVLGRRPGAARRWMTMAVLATAVSGAFVEWGHTEAARRGVLNPVNVLGLEPLLSRMGGHIHVLSMSLVALALVGIAAALCWRFPMVAAALLAAGCLWAAIDVETGYIIPGSRARAAQNDVADALQAIATVPGADLACVGWDMHDVADFNYYNLRFRLPEQPFAALDGSDPASVPCGSLVVSDRPAVFAAAHPAARAITSEDYVDETLYALPRPGDPTFSALGRAGFLSPAASAAARLSADQLSGATLTGPALDGGVRVAAGRTAIVHLTLHHGAGGAPWPATYALRTGTLAVRVAARWPDAAGVPLMTADLPHTLLPGTAATVAVPIAAPRAPGTYNVQLQLLQEGVDWFTGPPATLTVTVT